MRALNVPLHLVMRTMAPITARITTLAVASSHLKPRVVGPIALSAGAAGQVLRRACCRCRPETSERIISSAVKYRRSLVSRLIIALPFAWETHREGITGWERGPQPAARTGRRLSDFCPRSNELLGLAATHHHCLALSAVEKGRVAEHQGRKYSVNPSLRRPHQI